MLNKEGQRELAYVVEVDNVQPIEGYDKIRWVKEKPKNFI